MNKKVALLLVVVFCLFTFSGVMAEEKVLRLWTYSDYGSGDLGAITQKYADEFLAKNYPDYKLEITAMGDDELITSLTTAAMNGDMPELFVNSASYGALLAGYDAMINLYDLWNAEPEEWREKFNEDAMKAFMPEDGVLYSLPFTGFSSYMFRNLDVLEAAGIDPNEPIVDTEMWVEQMKKVTDAGFYGTYTFSHGWWDFLQIYSAFCEPDEWGIDYQNNESLINVEKMAEAVEFVHDIAQYGVNLGRGDQAAQDLFISNKMAFFPDGPWTDIVFGNSGVRYDVVPVPGKEPGKGNYGGVGGLEIFCVGNTPEWKVSYELAKYLCDTPHMLEWGAVNPRFLFNNEALSALAAEGYQVLEAENEVSSSVCYNQPPFFQKAVPGNYYSELVDMLDMAVNGEIDDYIAAVQEVVDGMTAKVKEEYE